MAIKPHWFPFYVPDFLSSPTVTMMSAEEVGGYVLLLCYAWQDPHGSIPSDDESLRVLSRVKGDLSRLKSCFTEKRGRLHNKRLAQELEKVKEKSDAAKRSIAIRWNSVRNTNVQRTKYSSQSESQSQSESELQSDSESETQSESEKKNVVHAVRVLRKPSPPISDEDWILSLQRNPTYAGVDVTRELGKCRTWCETNRKPFSRRRFVNWINRAERPLQAQVDSPFQRGINDFILRHGGEE